MPVITLAAKRARRQITGVLFSDKCITKQLKTKRQNNKRRQPSKNQKKASFSSESKEVVLDNSEEEERLSDYENECVGCGEDFRKTSEFSVFCANGGCMKDVRRSAIYKSGGGRPILLKNKKLTDCVKALYKKNLNMSERKAAAILKISPSYLHEVKVNKAEIKSHVCKSVPHYINDQNSRAKTACRKIVEKLAPVRSGKIIIMDDETYCAVDPNDVPDKKCLNTTEACYVVNDEKTAIFLAWLTPIHKEDVDGYALDRNKKELGLVCNPQKQNLSAITQLMFLQYVPVVLPVILTQQNGKSIGYVLYCVINMHKNAKLIPYGPPVDTQYVGRLSGLVGALVTITLPAAVH
ncbi:hypothetical protein ILUMI_06818 [Ignelater luminosus]|uniref:Uncharacterized protein n=1 Tax=Ignelater luminosus TaxID=2038154 RepID=A0A8K0D9X2_IGNLU|nr:hypothetical protein ILUMI_06818 [Ignelater luminosus]